MIYSNSRLSKEYIRKISDQYGFVDVSSTGHANVVKYIIKCPKNFASYFRKHKNLGNINAPGIGDKTRVALEEILSERFKMSIKK